MTLAAGRLVTKLHRPSRREGVLERPRLRERLARVTSVAVTVVSAPAGFGKTTLLTEWLASDAAAGSAVAWFSIDEHDNDPVLFWSYVVAALQSALPDAGSTAEALLQSPQVSIDLVLSTLINELDGVTTDVVLVLDDYHLIESREIERGVGFLVDHLPARLHLVIVGRADPSFPVARLRARGQLLELRAEDLRFSGEETASYLGGLPELSLTGAQVAVLAGRTEGWIAALQLAALSMQGRDDIAGFIAGFAGDDRYLIDFLAEEVLNRQSDRVRDFLLRTSILERLSGPLCDAVTGGSDGHAMLARLEQANLFLVPLDRHRRWYRYHHLFADVLQVHLVAEASVDPVVLHRRAGAWYEADGQRPEAIAHRLAAGDIERAAALIEQQIPTLRRNRQDATLRRYLDALPADLIRRRPVLTMGYAGSLMVQGEVAGVESYLGDAERWLADAASAGGVGPASAGETVIGDAAELARIPATIEMYRAALALTSGDAAGTVSHARTSTALAAEDDHLTRASASALMGLAFWGDGDLDAGHQAYADCLAGLERAGHIADTLGCAVALADIRITQGRLDEAAQTYTRALQRAADQDGPVLRGTADLYVGLSEICRERNQLTEASRHLARSEEFGEHLGLPQHPYRWRVAMAGLRQAEGDLPGALELFDQAERRYVGDFFPDVRPVAAMKVRLWLTVGRLPEALGWARAHRLAAADDLAYRREFEHITLAQVLLAQHAAERQPGLLDQVGGLLERLLRAAESGARTRNVLEVLLLSARVAQARGDGSAALAFLRRAVALAEPGGHVRVVLDNGPELIPLLRTVARNGSARSYARRLLAAVEPVAPSMAVTPELIEPLSDRERDVLRLLGSDLGGPDIARELSVSLNTVRTHTKSIYTKLGVNTRRAAVRRAQELDLLARGIHHIW